MLPHLLPLDTSDARLDAIGGKGVNLAFLARENFPVPPGFFITTAVYRAFVAHPELKELLEREWSQPIPEDPAGLNALSDRIRRAFRAQPVPATLADAILTAYVEMGAPPVAVRSSATAEDLPDMSFAGQQDTFLNIQGPEALLDAVRDCWSSLWTARAIGYRARNGIDHSQVALAVIIQSMIQSQASGVLFTANPLTGKRDETVIDATLGLGEALVSGLVEPDHYVVNTASRAIVHRQIGAKATVIHGNESGGTTVRQQDVQQQDAQATPALTDAQIGQLVEWGARVAAAYAEHGQMLPQDIEWAYADGQFYLLQSRPITALYPLPAPRADTGLRVYLSFGGIQGVLDPFTALGQDTIKSLMTGGAHLLGFAGTTLENQKVFASAGSRLWVDITGLVRHATGRRVIARVLPIADPAGVEGLQRLFADPRLAVTGDRPSPDLVQQLRPAVLKIVRTALWTLLRPHQSRQAALNTVETALADVRAQAEKIDSLQAWAEFHRRLAYAIFPLIVPLFVPRVLVAYLSLQFLHRLAGWLGKQTDHAVDAQTALALTRSLPHNVTTEMDLALWQLAQHMRADDSARRHLEDATPTELAESYRAGTLPPAIQTELEQFLDRYGMRGVAEIDFGRPRWRDEPVGLFATLGSYLQNTNPDAAPDAVFRRGEAAAEEAIQKLAHAAAAQWGQAAGLAVRWLALRVRALAGLRETPKLTLITLLDISRHHMLEQARRAGSPAARQGLGPEDLFMLQLNEIMTLALGAPGDWSALIAQRRAAYAREQRRRPIPRLLLSDGTALFDGMGVTAGDPQDANHLTGQPVSAGVVEGKVRVVFDPSQAQLQHGEIMVCPGTDPAWTPLFLVAGGLVMEVGGLMTHGSVVAREYGIPAVVGVDRATTRLQTGDTIRLDGAAGTIVRVETAETAP